MVGKDTYPSRLVAVRGCGEAWLGDGRAGLLNPNASPLASVFDAPESIFLICLQSIRACSRSPATPPPAHPAPPPPIPPSARPSTLDAPRASLSHDDADDTDDCTHRLHRTPTPVLRCTAIKSAPALIDLRAHPPVCLHPLATSAHRPRTQPAVTIRARPPHHQPFVVVVVFVSLLLLLLLLRLPHAALHACTRP